jgi:lipoate-protein ligase A
MDVSAPSCRFFPFAVAEGAVNMAADEVLLENALAGQASLRFYGWMPPTLSLGYFQKAETRWEDPLLASLPYVRRASGGLTLVHHHEVTYALALPAGLPWQTGESWLSRMHLIIAAALAEFGILAQLHQGRTREHLDGPLCFRHFSDGDLMLDVAKIVGSAQRKVRGGLMQHGGLMLAGSPFTPVLPGIRELKGKVLAIPTTCAALQRHFQQQTGWNLVPADWDEKERQRIEDLAEGKYRQAAWNNKR